MFSFYLESIWYDVFQQNSWNVIQKMSNLPEKNFIGLKLRNFHVKNLQ